MKNINIEKIKEIVKEVSNNKDAALRLGISRGTFKKIIKHHNIDISHFWYGSIAGPISKRLCKKCGNEFTCMPYKKKIYCSNSCANSHLRSNVQKQKISKSIKQRMKVCKWGIQLQTRVPKIKKKCPICENEFETNKKKKIYCCRKCYCNDKTAKYRNVGKGGYRKGSGTGKHGYYKEFYCDSTYELAYVIYCIDHNILIQRNRQKFEYYVDNEKHHYYPDFILNDKFIEIKGYYSLVTDLKSKAVTKLGFEIDVLYKADLKYVFDYVCKKYNVTMSNLHKLYDDYKPQYEYNCSYCKKSFKSDKQRHSNSKYCSRSCAGLSHKQF